MFLQLRPADHVHVLVRLLPPDRLHLLRRPQRDRLPAFVQVLRGVPDFQVMFPPLLEKFLFQEVSLL